MEIQEQIPRSLPNQRWRKSSYTGQTISYGRCFSESGEWKDLHPCRNVERRWFVSNTRVSESRFLSFRMLPGMGKSSQRSACVSPCRSTRFHIKGITVVCNACGTEWNLETLKGIQGYALIIRPTLFQAPLCKTGFKLKKRSSPNGNQGSKYQKSAVSNQLSAQPLMPES